MRGAGGRELSRSSEDGLCADGGEENGKKDEESVLLHVIGSGMTIVSTGIIDGRGGSEWVAWVWVGLVGGA
jgi:hypothetical protein